MMNNQQVQPRRMLPPGNTRKRKHTEADKPDTPKSAEPIASSNRLLAGYLAHEYLSKGTLFGHKFEAYPENMGRSAEPIGSNKSKSHESYGEVARIMKTDGTHIKGIVNPTQLSRWMEEDSHVM